MRPVAERLLDEVLSLSERERLEVASEILASVEGPADEGWDAAWLDELERRRTAQRRSEEPAAEWAEVRAHVLESLSSRRQQ